MESLMEQEAEAWLTGITTGRPPALIRKRAHRVCAELVAMGKDLRAFKRTVPEGLWKKHLWEECGMTEETAAALMDAVYLMRGRNPKSDPVTAEKVVKRTLNAVPPEDWDRMLTRIRKSGKAASPGEA